MELIPNSNKITEEWRDIAGYEGFYQVSNMGRVRSLDRMVKQNGKKDRFCKGVVLRPSLNTSGYYRVSLCRNGIHDHQIHRLVAAAFIGGNDNTDVDHINFDKKDNRSTNLQYISHIENVRRSKHYVKQYDRNGALNPKAKRVIGLLNGAIVEQYDCGKYLCEKLNMKYTTFKSKIQHNKLIINNIHYIYETNFT